MNKNESKYFHTARKMNEALLALLEKKDFDYITVKEICATANVNRSTFYLHYETISDLLEETTRYILDKHFSYYSIDTPTLAHRIATCKRQELVFITAEYLTPYLTFVKENQRIFKLAITHFRLMNMQEVYNKLFQQIFEPILSRFCIPKQERTYIIKFYLTGIYAIVMEWLDKDCADDMDTVISVITSCVIGERTLHE